MKGETVPVSELTTLRDAYERAERKAHEAFLLWREAANLNEAKTRKERKTEDARKGVPDEKTC